MVAAVATLLQTLCLLKSLTVILCSLAYLRRASNVTSLQSFWDLTHFLTSKCFVAWKKSSVWHTFFASLLSYYHLSNSWCIGRADQLSHALPVWCHCTSQFGSSRRLTLLWCLWWPWRLPQVFGSFGNEPMQSCSVCHVSLSLSSSSVSLASASVYSPPSDSFDHRNFISCKYMQLYP